jgi:transposase
MAMTIVETAAVTGGVNSGADTYVVAAIDDVGVGGLLGVGEFPAHPAGCQALLDWLAAFGPLRVVGIDSTGGWGGWLARHLGRAGVAVADLGPPQGRPGGDETAAGDAVGTARAGQGRLLPAGADPMAEAIGVLMVARRSAQTERAAALREIRALVAAAPADVSLGLCCRTTVSLIAETAALRSGPGHPVGVATRVALASLGDRAACADRQIGRLDELLIPLVAAHVAGLVVSVAVGADDAVTLLAAADDGMGA